MKVLVTGGAGFIGSHVIEELLNYKYEVIVIDNLVTGLLENIPKGIKLYRMDLNHPKIETIFELEKPDYVIHLAAQASVMASMKNPYYDFDSNTVGTVKILHLSKKYHVKKMVFASTAAVYGEPTYFPIDENHTINPQSFYALSKCAAEKYIDLYGIHQGMENCILRFSNVYGPGQNVNGEAGIISLVINRLLANENVRIFDGSQTRDFIYVKDVAIACRLTLEGNHRGVFNISSCTETAIDDLYFLIADVMGVEKIPMYEPRRVGEIEKSVLDNRKARTELGWNPVYTLSNGLKESVQFYSELKIVN